MQMFAGAMIGIRNPKAHEVITISRKRAVYFLFLVSPFDGDTRRTWRTAEATLDFFPLS